MYVPSMYIFLFLIFNIYKLSLYIVEDVEKAKNLAKKIKTEID